jgi:hypothetical protein
MVKAADRARTIGATTIQVFSDNPTSWRRRPEPPTELPKFRQRIAELDIGPIATHAPYLINLAGPGDHLRSADRCWRQTGMAPVAGQPRQHAYRLAPGSGVPGRHDPLAPASYEPSMPRQGRWSHAPSG